VVSLLVMNGIALFSNYSAIRRVRALAAQAPAPYSGNPYAPHRPEQSHRRTRPGPPTPPQRPARPSRTTRSGRRSPAPRPAAGLVPQPSGPGQRYWDGVTWTHWTHPR
jgi:hypothetical protein